MVNDSGVDFTLRMAESADAEQIVGVYAETRAASVPAMPAPIHTVDEDREFFVEQINGAAEVWLAEAGDADGGIVAFLVIQEDWVHSLYVRPSCTGQGIGSALLDIAKVSRPHGFALWVFESNARARRFYERRDLVAVRRTDGSGNEERAPDIQMLWPGTDPVPVLRGAIDRLDRELARLLDLRSGLTAQVQPHKSAETGTTAPRDPAREAEIVASMASYAPRLGSKRLAKIMQVVIAESLDAVGAESIRDRSE